MTPNRVLDNLSNSLVFVVGAPRSGTTWVQQMLGSHPQVATPHETAVFSSYLASVYARWDKDLERIRRTVIGLREGENHERLYGLPSVMFREDLDEVARHMVRFVRTRALESKPGATVSVEKSPRHALFARLIADIFPEAKFIHVIRDPRSVVASLMRAARGWGHYWAPTSTSLAVRRWCLSIEHAQQLNDESGRCMEIRYEDLRRDVVGALAALFDHVEVDISREQCLEISERRSLQRQRNNGSSPMVINGEAKTLLGDTRYEEPTGFYGLGDGESSLTPWQRWVIDRIAGELMRKLGYAEGREWIDIPPWMDAMFLAWWRVTRSVAFRSRRRLTKWQDKLKAVAT